MELSQEMSLASKVAAAREASKSQVIESDTKKREERAEMKAARKAERVAKREARIEKFKATIEKTKQKIKEFREWDRKNALGLLGEIKAAPEIVKLTADAGVESSKKFAIDRKNEVVEKAREVGNWVEDRGNDIENFVDNTKDGIKESINIGVEKVQMKYEQTRERITTTYTETKTSLSNEVKKGKDNLVKAWRRVQAIPVDIKVSKDQKDAVKNYEKMQMFRERYERSDSSIAKGMEKSKQLKGTSSELRRAMA